MDTTSVMKKLNDVFSQFKDLADRKKEILDEDILGLLENTRGASQTIGTKGHCSPMKRQRPKYTAKILQSIHCDPFQYL